MWPIRYGSTPFLPRAAAKSVVMMNSEAVGLMCGAAQKLMPSRVSAGGMARRVMLARAIALGTDLISSMSRLSAVTRLPWGVLRS